MQVRLMPVCCSLTALAHSYHSGFAAQHGMAWHSRCAGGTVLSAQHVFRFLDPALSTSSRRRFMSVAHAHSALAVACIWRTSGCCACAHAPLTHMCGVMLSSVMCSAGVIALDLARELLQLHPGKIALVVSHENITNNFYAGEQRMAPWTSVTCWQCI